MDVHELNRDQLIQLKQSMLCDRDAGTSYGELAAADELVTDEEVYNKFCGTVFTEDDFT